MHNYLLRRAILSMLITALIAILLSIPSHCQALPDAPRPERVIDRKFLAVVGTLALAKSADWMTTAKHLHEQIPPTYCSHLAPGENCYFQEVSSAYLFGRYPSTGRMIAENAALFAGQTALTYYLKKKHFRLWWAPAAYFTAEHIYLAKQNTRF